MVSNVYTSGIIVILSSIVFISLLSSMVSAAEFTMTNLIFYITESGGVTSVAGSFVNIIPRLKDYILVESKLFENVPVESSFKFIHFGTEYVFVSEPTDSGIEFIFEDTQFVLYPNQEATLDLNMNNKPDLLVKLVATDDESFDVEFQNQELPRVSYGDSVGFAIPAAAFIVVTLVIMLIYYKKKNTQGVGGNEKN